ncbi:class I SAM-dependent methyltransferase [Nocardioides gansuensis]|uniref:Class I SAM-dependent methyltransferase n=1 Tax=Nocardioides gansuensis TaxID=2138300 RepID=A0A2T8F8L0_9ACTN|nr:class I SAM-dependent methyltransferase [Nocardioides gansuensis]PVG82056.1 class I SAM-dependent methyltransferase [Nocardioides gansuensis]
MTDAQAATVQAYDADAARYAAETRELPESVRRALDEIVGRLPSGARVLEIGSGGGRDAAYLEEHGLRVRRTDITPGFVALLREQGHQADVLDPLTDDLASPEGPYDAVWASASLLHVARTDLGTVLARLAEATRPGGLLRISLKEGDGEAWSTHGAISAPRLFTYWREEDLRRLADASGWVDVAVDHVMAGRTELQPWLEITAVRA